MALCIQTGKPLLGCLDFLQLRVPSPFQLARCKPVASIDRVVLFEGPFLPHTPVAPSCGTGRHVERRRWRSVLRALADWLPPPKARSPLVVLAPPGDLPSRRQSRCNTARHHHSCLCKDSVHWYRGHPNTVHVACVHSDRNGGVLPEDPGQRVSPPSIRPPPGSRNYAAPSVGSLRMWSSQYNPHDDRG